MNKEGQYPRIAYHADDHLWRQMALRLRAEDIHEYVDRHPGISPSLYYFGLMTPPTYRAAVRNAYTGP